MSKALIEAVKRGDLKAVELELEKPDVDVNIDASNNRYESKTPLLLALDNKQWDIAKRLVLKGALLEKENCTSYEGGEVMKYPFVSVCAKASSNANSDSIDPELFRLMIAKVKIINPLHSGYSGHDIPSLTGIARRHQSEQLFAICAHEAFIRGEFLLLKDFSKLFRWPISAESLRKHVKDRQFTHHQVQVMHQTITQLTGENYIRDDISKELKQWLETLDSKSELTADCFPTELQKLLKNDGRSLQEQFAEFQSLIYPEENLPPLVLGSVSFEFFNSSCDVSDREKVLRMQNPLVLRAFLTCDETSLLIRFANADMKRGGTHAAYLLASIILWHANTLITVNGKTEPLLNKDQQKRGIMVINSLYGLTRTEKLLMRTTQQQTIELRELTKTVNSLSKQLDRMENMLSAVLGKQSSVTPIEEVPTQVKKARF